MLLIPSLVSVLWMTTFGGTAITQIVSDGYTDVADAAPELQRFLMLAELPLTQITGFPFAIVLLLACYAIIRGLASEPR